MARSKGNAEATDTATIEHAENQQEGGVKFELTEDQIALLDKYGIEQTESGLALLNKLGGNDKRVREALRAIDRFMSDDAEDGYASAIFYEEAKAIGKAAKAAALRVKATSSAKAGEGIGQIDVMSIRNTILEQAIAKSENIGKLLRQMLESPVEVQGVNLSASIAKVFDVADARGYWAKACGVAISSTSDFRKGNKVAKGRKAE